MNDSLAVLLLRIAGAPDMPPLTYAQQLFTTAGRGTRNLVDYYDEVSHGFADLSGSHVYDWVDYGHTRQDLQDVFDTAHAEKKDELLKAGSSEADAETAALGHAHSTRRDRIFQWALDAAAAHQLNLAGFKAIVCIFNQDIDMFGSTGHAVLSWNPASGTAAGLIDLTGVAHEVGHALGLSSHSRLEGSPAEYGDRWDIMSAYDGTYRDRSGMDTPPGSPYVNFGPGLNAVNMDRMGWLDARRLFTREDHGGGLFTLRALHRRDLPGWLAARLDLGGETLFLELRVPSGWDAAIPRPCILLHRRIPHPTDGDPTSELVIAQPHAPAGPRADLRSGESFECGDSNDPFGYFARVTVTHIDVENAQASLEIYVRPRRQVEPSGTPFGGVTRDGGGLIWVPGRGFVRIPPRSPLLVVMAQIADYQALQEMATGRERADIQRAALARLTGARDSLSAIVTARTAPRVPALEAHAHTTGTE